MNDRESIRIENNRHTEYRIRIKRKAQRKKKIDKAMDFTTIIMMVIIAGLLTYAVMELRIGIQKKAESRPAEVRTAGLNQEVKSIYDCFATVGTSSLKLSLPGRLGSVIGIGFHQAGSKQAVALRPLSKCYDRESTTTVAGSVQKANKPVMFIMESRGRGSALTSAADVAMKAGSDVYSPVDGVIKKVATYNLYGKLMDNHVEIEPDGYPGLRVVIIHIYGVRVKVGQKVSRQTTRIATMRPLPQIKSQINYYLPEAADHIHLQIVPATVKGKVKS